MSWLKQNKVFIIAEAGVNHNGDMELAKRLINAAHTAGADAVKFQSFKADRLASVNAPKASYQMKTTNAGESQWSMLKKLELTEEHHVLLMDYCQARGIMFLSTPFDETSADYLDRQNVRIFKIPSGEVTNHSFLRHVAGKGRPMILSTGMSDLDEVRTAVNIIQGEGVRDLSLLHCVTQYPAPYGEINLRAIPQMAAAFDLPVGYSDHTDGIDIAVAAVALGARIVEKHLTLDRNMEGPDHRASIEPDMFADMVRAIRNVTAALGDGVKRCAPCEQSNRDVVRKSITVAEDMASGEILTAERVVMKRPGSGIAPSELDNVLGRKIKTALSKDTLLEWGHIE